MKLKGVLLAGAAILVCGLSGQAQAEDRLSLYEINTFVTKLTNAVNNPDPYVGRSSLLNNVSTNATFTENLNSTWVDGRYYGYQVWNGYYASPYYRYPYAHNAYLRPTGYKTVSKMDMINQLEHKKNMVPRYHQTISILGTNMPVDASSAVLDVRLKEFGLNYALAPYGYQYGAKVEQSDARCAMHLKKQGGDILITKMTCNTVLHGAI